MHFVRRAAARAATSQVISARSISTRTTPFAIRSSKPAPISPLYRRWISNKPVDEVNTSSIAEQAEPATDASAETGAEEIYTSTEAQPAVNDLSDNAYQRAAAEAPKSADESDTGVASAVASTRRPARRPLDPQTATPSKTVYVGNLIFELNNEELIKLFSPFGKIMDAGIRLDARGLSKGFAFITFETQEAATAAVETMNNYVHEGRDMVVSYQLSKPKFEFQRREPTKTLFIGNISFEVTDADLNRIFRDIKNCVDVRVAVDRRTGQPRGFAHADFLDVKSATKGLEILENITLYGRKLRIDYSAEARPTTPRD